MDEYLIAAKDAQGSYTNGPCQALPLNDDQTLNRQDCMFTAWGEKICKPHSLMFGQHYITKDFVWKPLCQDKKQ